MEDQDQTLSSENQLQEEQVKGEDEVVAFLDSMDAYLTLIDSLSSTLRQVECSRNYISPSAPFSIC